MRDMTNAEIKKTMTKINIDTGAEAGKVINNAELLY